MISNMQHAVDTGVHELLLLVAQVLANVFRDEHDVTLHVDHKKEAIQGLSARRKEEGNQEIEGVKIDKSKEEKMEIYK